MKRDDFAENQYEMLKQEILDDMDKQAELIRAAKVVLDCVDYTHNACSATEMVGAVLPAKQLVDLRKAIKNLEGGQVESVFVTNKTWRADKRAKDKVFKATPPCNKENE